MDSVSGWRRGTSSASRCATSSRSIARHVLITVRQFGRGALSGIEIEMTTVMLFEIDAEGKIVRFQLHLRREAALEQAGER